MKYLIVILISGVSLITSLFVAKPALSQCLQADVSLQYNISPNPAQRTNNINLNNSGTCIGNTSVTYGVQGYVGNDNLVIQNRTVNQIMIGGNSHPTGINLPSLQIKNNLTIDIPNNLPSYPNFYQKKSP